MNNSFKVGEIFTSAGTAFHTLGELTTQLSSSQQNSTSGAAKWTEEEVEMLHNAVLHFANDLDRISRTIKQRTVQQIKGALKKKAFEEAGLSPPSEIQTTTTMAAAVTTMTTTTTATSTTTSATTSTTTTTTSSSSSADVTLNMLNAADHEVDVEGLGSEIGL